jgi:TPR repeat protein
MKKLLGWLGWFVVIMLFWLAGQAGVPFYISGPAILGPIILWIVVSSVFFKTKTPAPRTTTSRPDVTATPVPAPNPPIEAAAATPVAAPNPPIEAAAVDPYEQAGEELMSGRMAPSVWARAIVEGGGVEGPMRAAYVKLRVADLERKAAEVAAAANQATQEAAARKLAAATAFDSGDHATALPICREMAEAGDAPAQRMLALILQSGRGLKESIEAVGLFTKAAEQGDAEAQNSLAVAYANGSGVGANFGEAYKWFTLASEGGVDSAILSRDLLSAKMSPAEIAQAQQQAADWRAR